MTEKIIIGSANFVSKYGYNGSQLVDHERLSELLRNNYLTIIDSALDYNCQPILRKYYSNFEIDTKITYKNNFNNSIADALHKFMDDCNTSKIRTLYIHDPWNIPNAVYPRVIEELRILKQKKIIKEVGLSIYWDKHRYDLAHIDRVQVPFSVMHGKAVKFLRNFKQKKMNITIRNLFLQGRLLSGNDYTHFTGADDVINKIPKKVLRDNTWRLRNALSVLNISEVDNAVVGVDNTSQLREILDQVNTNRPELMQAKLEFLDPRNWSKI